MFRSSVYRAGAHALVFRRMSSAATEDKVRRMMETVQKTPELKQTVQKLSQHMQDNGYISGGALSPLKMTKMLMDGELRRLTTTLQKQLQENDIEFGMEDAMKLKSIFEKEGKL